MATSSQTYTSVEGYAFHLRADLRTAANEGLAPLRNTMEEMGYGWLDGYLEGVVGSSSRAPITELMKTPSRTATTKKTRATTAAAKDRTEKVKGLNTRLALLSPSPSKGSPAVRARQPFSPLQPRSLNAPLPPQPIFSPSPLKSQATKGKSKEKEKEKGKTKATKGKKGKGKKVDEGSVGILSPPSKTSSRSKQGAQVIEVEPSPTGPSITRTEAEEPDEPDILVKQPSKADSTVDNDLEENQARRPPVSGKTAQGKPRFSEEKIPERGGKDLSDAPVAPPQAEQSMQGSVGKLDAVETPSPITTFELAPVVATTSSHPVRVPDLSMIAEESSRIDSASVSIESLAVTRSVAAEGKPAEEVTIKGSAASQPIQSAPPPPAPAPKVPVRQVRSSWLSKALGTDTVPVSHTSDLRKSFAAGAELRKSFAPVSDSRKSFAASSVRPNTPVDLAVARKSIAPANVLKRKSEVGMEEETLHIERPEKVARFDDMTQQAVITPQNEVHYDFPIALASSPRATASLPHLTPAANEHSRGERGRSDIHKVSRALDELRERAQAKEAAAKAKAAAIAHAQKIAMYEPKAQSTGSGFLRGLGNSLGRSLGFGTARSAEEEARQREEEELAEQQAKEELERLMAVSPNSIREHTVQDMGRSTSPLGQPTQDKPRSKAPGLPVDLVATSPVAPVDQLDEDEVMDESEVIDELDDDETDERAPLITVADSKTRSTTPTGTPPRVPVAVAAAPPLHSRIEKHVHGEAAKKPKLMPEEEAPASQRTEAAQLIKPPTVLAQDKPIIQENSRWAGAGMDMEEDELDEEEEEEERIEELPRKGEHRDDQAKFSMAPTALSASTSSQSTSAGFFGHASTMANKALGVKASAGPVKSIQLAAAAAKKVSRLWYSERPEQC
ncbi:hypothetical protein BCR39DRAFT_525761 [Naematelia encephala]|uniref:Inner centromere protein ARK-binding domain-containing protein n=1 Tax=Naematelia encephala TaxID=71784 RepID=A0A1Y2BAH8_9TREE|nr:hypothetical protein BCR39DRAFT_525761 [Naematelia encephala]